MKKRVTGLVLALCLCLGLLPTAAFADAGASATADFTASDGGAAAIALLNESKTGAADSAWDSASRTLTLNGVDFATTAPTAVRLPAGSTIVLADGTVNTIRGGDAAADVSGEYKNEISITALDALGDLTIQGGAAGTGALSVTSGSHRNAGNGWTYSSGITVGGSLTVQGGCVTVTGGLAEATGKGAAAFSIGVNMDSGVRGKTLQVSGGSLTAIAGEAYRRIDAEPDPEFSRGVYLYRGSVSVSGSGSLTAKSVPEMAGAGLLSSGLYISAGDLTIDGSGAVTASGAYGVDISGGGIALRGGSLTASSTQTADTYSYAIDVGYESSLSSTNTADAANITVSGGTLKTENGNIYISDYGAPDTNGLFTVTGGTVENGGQLTGARKVSISSGGTVQSRRIDAGELTLDNAFLTVREPVRESKYTAGLLLASPALELGKLTVSGGTLEVSWDWGAYTPFQFPVDDYYGYRTPLVEMPRDTAAASFTGGTAMLDTGCAGNTALHLGGQLTLGTGVAETGADVDGTGTHSQRYTDTPVVFSAASRTPVDVVGVTAQSKPYDGTTAATLTAGTLTGAAGGDRVSLGSAGVTAHFDTANVGTGKSVTVTGGTFDLRGRDAYLYILRTQPTGLTGLTADITPCQTFTDATERTQTVAVGDGSFAQPRFTGIGGEAVTGRLTYTVDGAPITEAGISERLQALEAGETLTVSYEFSASGNYSGTASGSFTVTAQERTVPDIPYVPAPAYPVNTPEGAQGGSVSASVKSAPAGSTVVVTVRPNAGHQLGSLTVTDENGSPLPLTGRGDGTYSFTMPAGGVTVSAVFVKEGGQTSFADVPASAYYYDAAAWAAGRGIAGGVGGGLFAPEDPCTRGQIVTFLWRAAGSPEPVGAAAFADVPAGSYYEKAVAWAVENGVTTGTGDGRFGPDDPCTRAQAVTFLARALKAKAVGAAAFADVPADSYFAGAVAWAVENGVTTGTGDGKFSPDDPCTRGQIVTFLYRAYQK